VDVNNDGFQDVLMADSGGNRVGVMLGNGNGTFSTLNNQYSTVWYATGTATTPYCMTTADFNEDGLGDVATGNIGTDNISVLYGN
jgi:hypothetical protein